jgi:hypothetical protein
MQELDPERMKLVKGGLPQKFAERVSFQTSGQKQVGQEDDILTLWKEFQKCYPTKQKALDALSKNTAVILPQLNAPSKIKGTFAQLKQRFGQKGAQEIVEKNPGILVCSPQGLLKQSDKQILDAANLVETLDKNKPIIQALAGAVWIGILLAVGTRIGTVGATPPGL